MQSQDTGLQTFIAMPKTTLLHQTRAFHATQLDIDLCSNLLTAILYQLSQGEEYSKDEKTSLFFGCTKLFQSKNVFVRRLTYCLIRALHPTPEDTIIIISCLSRDINNASSSAVTTEIYRSNSIRLLFSLVDESMIQNIERLLTQTLIGDSAVSVKSALIAAQHVYRYSPESIRRWKAEIHKSLTHNDQVIQYHALSLALKMVQNDPIAAQRFVTTTLKSSPSHGKRILPTILQLRVVSKAMSKVKASSHNGDPLYPVEHLEYLRDTLGDGNHTGIQLESAKIILKFLTFTQRPEYGQFLQYATGILIQILTRSASTIVHKFSTLRLLNELAQTRTELLIPHNDTIDMLLAGGESSPFFQNRTLTMYVINLSLKAGNDQNIDLFLSSLESVVLSAPDDSKLSVLLNIRDYVLHKNQSKFAPIVSFMFLLLKYENRFIIKNTIVTCFHSIMATIPRSIPFILDLIAEHIEDCEYPRVTIRIINLIAQYAYLHPHRPEKYLRFLFNRTILETSSIRSAAVSAIMRIAITLHLDKSKNQTSSSPTSSNERAKRGLQIQHTIISLLNSVCYDYDDEVRDRARLYLDLLKRIQSGHQTVAQSTLELLTNTTFSQSKLLSEECIETTKLINSQSQHPTTFNPELPPFIQHDTFSTFPSYHLEATPLTLVPSSALMHGLPDLDAIEASAMSYLQDNFNINTTSQGFCTSHLNNIDQSHDENNSSIDPSESLPTLPAFGTYLPPTQHFSQPNNCGVFDPILHYTPPSYQVTYNSQQIMTGGKEEDGSATASSPTAISAQQQHSKVKNINNETEAPQWNQLHERLPSNIARYLDQNGVTNYWQCRYDVTKSTTTSTSPTSNNNNNNKAAPNLQSTSGHTTTEFPSKINQYIFHNGSILFETHITHNFNSAVVQALSLQIDELQNFHNQGHVAIQCLSLLGTIPSPNGTNNNDEVINLQKLNDSRQLDQQFQFGSSITIYTLFTIKNINLLINLCSAALTFRLQYLFNNIDDGEQERGQYQLSKLQLSPSLFLQTPQQFITCIPQQQQQSQLPSIDYLYNFDYRAAWEALPSTAGNNLPTETSLSFTIPLDPSIASSNDPQSQYKQVFAQQLDQLLTNLSKVAALTPTNPQFNLKQSIASLTQCQILIPLHGIYLNQQSIDALKSASSNVAQPSRVLCRVGGMLQQNNNAMLIRVMIKSSNPHVTKLLANLIKV